MRNYRLAALSMMLVSFIVLTGCAVPERSVTVVAAWTGAEAEKFKAVLRAFTAKTGIEVDYQGTRDVEQVVTANVVKGTPPDVAVLPSLRELADYAADGTLFPLDDGSIDRTQYSQQWQAFQELGNTQGKLYVIPVKTNLKGLIWHRQPGSGHPVTWDGLTTKESAGPTATWCMGMGAPPASGWPGTDWIEDIFLHQNDPGLYRAWANGTVRWDEPVVRRAWEQWARIFAGPSAVHGGTTAAILTDFRDAGIPMFESTPGCSLVHQASFIMSAYESYPGRPRAGVDFGFSPFPDPVASKPKKWTVSADLAGMFRDSPSARALMTFLASVEGQRIWPGIPDGSAFSANLRVENKVYRDGVSRRVADILTSDKDVLCFDASDLMSPTMRSAFYRAVLEFLAEPDRIVTLLDDLERIAEQDRESSDDRTSAERDAAFEVPVCGTKRPK